MIDYETRQTKVTRCEFVVKTPVNWVELEKVYHHVAQAWRNRSQVCNQSLYDDTIRVTVTDEAVVLYYEVVETTSS